MGWRRTVRGDAADAMGPDTGVVVMMEELETGIRVMRRIIASGIFVIGMALGAPFAASAGPALEEARESAAAPVAVQVATPFAGLRDEAAMVLVGTALIGLAAAVRRAA